MSKAFTREDDVENEDVLPRHVSSLQPGARNLVTPGGARRLREELKQLRETERPGLQAAAAAGGAAGGEADEKLKRVNLRISELQLGLATAEEAGPPPPPHDTVRFGATVTVRDERGAETAYRIVGVDEANLERNEVSWLSPIARALLNARVGQRVPFKFPSGIAQLEIVGIRYEA
jgi:transcription elongation factor GreB